MYGFTVEKEPRMLLADSVTFLLLIILVTSIGVLAAHLYLPQDEDDDI